MRKKIENSDVERKILELLEGTTGSMSIKEVTKQLKEKYNIKLSPQIVKRYLKNLKKKGKIEEL